MEVEVEWGFWDLSVRIQTTGGVLCEKGSQDPFCIIECIKIVVLQI